MNDKDDKGNAINFNLFGQPNSDYRYIEMNVIPCKPEQLTSRNAYREKTSCVADLTSKKAMKDRLKETKKYLNNPQLTLLFNNSRFDL
jgi:hypothetical protein